MKGGKRTDYVVTVKAAEGTAIAGVPDFRLRLHGSSGSTKSLALDEEHSITANRRPFYRANQSDVFLFVGVPTAGDRLSSVSLSSGGGADGQLQLEGITVVDVGMRRNFHFSCRRRCVSAAQASSSGEVIEVACSKTGILRSSTGDGSSDDNDEGVMVEKNPHKQQQKMQKKMAKQQMMQGGGYGYGYAPAGQPAYGYAMPAQPGYAMAAQPGYGVPPRPGYGVPPRPGYPMVPQQGYGAPRPGYPYGQPQGGYRPGGTHNPHGQQGYPPNYGGGQGHY